MTAIQQLPDCPPSDRSRRIISNRRTSKGNEALFAQPSYINQLPACYHVTNALPREDGIKGEVHEGSGLSYLTVLPDDYDPEASYPLVIMLHGFGANMHDLAGLAPAINATGYVYACPNAPIPFNLGLGHAGFGWMTPRGGSTPEEIATSESQLADFFDKVIAEFNVNPGNSLLLGFSQGGGMTYRCGLGRPGTFAGLAALSATLPGADELDHRLPEERKQPIFVAHGRYDQMIAESTAHAAKGYLENAGYTPEFHVYDMGHEISGEVIRDLVAWMNGVLPPWETP